MHITVAGTIRPAFEYGFAKLRVCIQTTAAGGARIVRDLVCTDIRCSTCLERAHPNRASRGKAQRRGPPRHFFESR
jgi:hypothetical protein